jgi:hypothetical protein
MSEDKRHAGFERFLAKDRAFTPIERNAIDLIQKMYFARVGRMAMGQINGTVHPNLVLSYTESTESFPVLVEALKAAYNEAIHEAVVLMNREADAAKSGSTAQALTQRIADALKALKL